MIIILHPRATKPKNRRFPLAALAIAAVLEGKEEYVIVDGNVEHQASALEPSEVLDVFTPTREDYRDLIK